MTQKILVVDDDEAVLSGLLELLRSAGYRAVGARSVPAARKALIDEAPDLLITDVRLGPYNGLQLIATNPRPIPAIVVTGYQDPTLEAEAHRLGAEFLIKPWVPAAFLRLVAEKLSGITPARPDMTRRWPRRRVTKPVVARVGSGLARIMDVSYGGLCMEIHRTSAGSPPESFDVTFPEATLSVGVAVVWQKPVDEARWVCGASVRSDRPEWRQLVDAVS